MKNVFVYLLSVLALTSYTNEDDVISNLRFKSESFFEKYKRKKIQFFFDQPKYVPGDTARFNILYVNAKDLRPVEDKEIVHIALFNQEGKKILSQFVKITKGWTSCEMAIPTEIPPGKYLIVAFTDWMKNLPKELFFRQDFIIVGKGTLHGWNKKDTLLFYPEGGQLVADVGNRLAIRYSGSNSNAKVKIKENGAVVSEIQITPDSVAVYDFIPKLNTVYSAETEINSITRPFSFPPIKNEGLALKVLTDHESTLNVWFQLSPNEKGKKFYAAVYNHDKLIYHSTLLFDNELKSELSFSSNLFRGVAQLIVFDERYNVYAGRVIHMAGEKTESIKIKNLLPSYTTRERVNLTIESQGVQAAGSYRLLSARVINQNIFNDFERLEMDYLSFESEISNTFKFKGEKKNRTGINNYLITQTCPWFDLKRIINDNEPSIRTQSYMVLSGVAKFAKNGKPVRDSTLIMFFLQNHLQGFEAFTSRRGNFSIPLFFDIKQNDEFFYTSSYKGNDIDDVIVKMNDPDSSYIFSSDPWKMEEEPIDNYTVYTSQMTAINNSYNFFSASRVMQDSVKDMGDYLEQKLGGADKKITIKDFLLMPTMIEVAREILPAVEYRYFNNRHIVRVYTTSKKTTARKPNDYNGPLYVIDGFFTRDPKYFLSLNPADVINIRLITDNQKLLAIGKIGAHGIIIIRTKLIKKVADETHLISFRGLLSESHRGLSVKNLNSNRPYFDANLYWLGESTVLSSGNNHIIEFNLSDDVGKFIIELYGLTNDGEEFSAQQKFEIKFAGN